MKTVRITNDDLYRVLAGRSISVFADTDDDETVMLKLYTADELLAVHAKYTRLADQEPNMTREQAENLTRTHDLYALAESLKNR